MSGIPVDPLRRIRTMDMTQAELLRLRQRIGSLERYVSVTPVLGGGVAGGGYPEIPDGYITTDMLANLAVTAEKIDDLTITAGKIANATITATQLEDLTITAGKIANATITATQIQDLTITAAQIANGTITAGKIESGSLTGGLFVDSTITGGKIANQTIQAGNIENLTITAAQIANLTITGGPSGKIAGNTITEDNIVANTITASSIAANTITANEIAANTITANEIVANTITANELNIATLSAISANVGTLTAGTINGVIIYLNSTDASSKIYWQYNGSEKGKILGSSDGLGIYATGDMLLDPSGMVKIQASAWISGETDFGNDLNVYYPRCINIECSSTVTHPCLRPDLAATDTRGADIGTDTLYFRQVNAKDFQDRGCIVSADHLDDLQILKDLKVSEDPDNVNKMYGNLRLYDYKSFPRWIADIPSERGSEGHDGLSLNALISLLLGASRQLLSRVEALEAELVR